MAKNYETLEGYMITMDAAKLVIRITGQPKKDLNKVYRKLVKLAQAGEFQGCAYKQRMWQVRRDLIIIYAQQLKAELDEAKRKKATQMQLDIFDEDMITDTVVAEIENVPTDIELAIGFVDKGYMNKENGYELIQNIIKHRKTS